MARPDKTQWPSEQRRQHAVRRLLEQLGSESPVLVDVAVRPDGGPQLRVHLATGEPVPVALPDMVDGIPVIVVHERGYNLE
jgi:hypothetical protein